MSAELYEFGDVTVDLRRVEVRRGGEAVPLEPKSFDVLRHLVENRDRLVTKDELLDVAWKGTFVTPNVLTRAIAQLRKALGDDAFEARYIETVAKRGYRFIATVKVAGDGDSRSVTAEQAEHASPWAPRPKPAWQRWVTLAAAGLVMAIAAGAARSWLVSRDRAATVGETTPLAPRRLTVDTRHPYITPAVSPDGGSVAYASFQTGSAEIYVRGMAAGSRELPITSDGGGNIQPAFSPDGQWLAYASRRRGGIWVVPSTGGTPSQLASFGSSPSWSPDSQAIVFTSFMEGGLSSQAVLWTVRCDGSAPVQLTRPGSPAGGHVAPTWSHDGRLIVFRVGRDELRETWIVVASGGAPRRLATGTRPSTPRFSPDDRAVYWIGTTAEGNECLMRVKIAGDGDPEGEAEVILPFPGYLAESFSIGRDLTAVFSLNRLSANLFAIDIDAGGEASAPRQLTFDDVVNTYPDYGPTGRIAFHQEGVGRPTTAWLMDDDGRNREPLSAGLSASVAVPQWHPDGTRVFAFVTEPGSDQSHFGWIDLATRRLARMPLSASGAANQPSLSPDGQRLAFNVIGADGLVNVWVQRLDDGARRQVTFDREAMSYPRWSQDGKWLAVNIKRGNTAQVGVVPADGGPVDQLTSGPGQRWPYSFSPDGDQIAFGSGERGVWNIHTVSRRTKEVRQLTHLTTGRALFPAWSPRGTRIVFVHQDAKSSLWTAKLPEGR